MLKKIFKRLFIFIAGTTALIFLVILFSGRWYLYKGLWHTYFKGRPGPSATEYQIFSNRKVPAPNPVPLVHSKKYNSSRLPSETDSLLKMYNAIALVIIRNDSLIHEQYWDDYSDTSHTNSFSIAKTYCGALLGCAIKDGFIKSLDEPVSKFIPEFNEGEKSKITLRNLTSMTSGIDFNESYINPFAYPAEGYYGSDLGRASIHQGVCENPGKIFKYLSGNSALLGLCITKAVGKPLSTYLGERLWRDLECMQPAWWSLDREDGQEKGFCCLNSNAPDFARLGMLYLNQGNWKGKQVLDSDYVKQSIRPFECCEEDGSANCTYGYNWWLTRYKDENIFYARGILGQYLICIPSKKMVIVKLALKRRPKKNSNHTPDDVAMLIDAAKQMY
jgi:CubicO group peptidase (beta-lactamase class C family)